MTLQETTYYRDGQVTISNSRAVLGTKTYAMSNITSVTMGERPANRSLGAIFILLGAAGLCVGSASHSNAPLLIGILAVIAGIALIFIAKPSYIVKIGSAGGESDALIATDKDYIQKIVNAVNEAIIKRG